mgnify:FL=1
MSQNKKSPLKFPWITAGLAVFGYLSSKKKEKKAAKETRLAEKKYEERMQAYEDLQYQPIDADALKQENVFEDMEIDTSAYDLQRKSFQQQQANILQGLRGVSGSSGAAGLAQALSMQASKQAEELQVNVSQQITRNRELRLREQSRLNQQMTQIELANMEGARQFEIDQLTTLLNVEGQRVAGARQAEAGARQGTGSLISGLGSAFGGYLQGGGKIADLP